ncbi:unnamed protein product [Candida verbasci]|uniref:Uncharacterized protein n=1 Tax=Candida verbasci TaxID=1227364 RepID=A0A9W4TXP9_9ASCO|nr:unnamed protein product [Candida verbasci]
MFRNLIKSSKLIVNTTKTQPIINKSAATTALSAKYNTIAPMNNNNHEEEIRNDSHTQFNQKYMNYLHPDLVHPNCAEFADLF